MSNFIQTLLVGVALIIVGIYVISIPSPTQPFLFPAMGIVFIAGGVVAFIATLRN
ncbi:MAG: hypothetical protein ACYC6W_09310 [Nitrosotalea sp.]